LSGKWKGGIREIRFTDAIRSTVLANGRRMCISPKPALHQNGERIEMVFGTKASLELSYTAPKKILVHPKKMVLPRSFVANSALKTFATTSGPSLTEFDR